METTARRYLRQSQHGLRITRAPTTRLTDSVLSQRINVSRTDSRSRRHGLRHDDDHCRTRRATACRRRATCCFARRGNARRCASLLERRTTVSAINASSSFDQPSDAALIRVPAIYCIAVRICRDDSLERRQARRCNHEAADLRIFDCRSRPLDEQQRDRRRSSMLSRRNPTPRIASTSGSSPRSTR